MHFGVNKGDISSFDYPKVPALIVVLIVLIFVAVPRFLLVGGLPTTDEGFYAYYAQMAHASLAQGEGIPDAGPLMLYPLLVSWVFHFNVNHIIALRLVDLLVAVLAGYALFRIIEFESRSRLGAILIAPIFLFTMNHSIFIQYGFKNSIHAAYIPMFFALWLALAASNAVNIWRWFCIGALLSFSVLLRETFLSLAVLGAFTILIRHGVRPFGQLIMGAFSVGALVLGIILIVRGGVISLLESYRDAGLVYASVSDQRVDLFFSSGMQALRESVAPTAVTVVGFLFISIYCFVQKHTKDISRAIFWLIAALIPLLEPVTKIGYPYHFGVSLAGMAGLSALGWRNICQRSSTAQQAFFSVLLSIILLIETMPRFLQLSTAWTQTLAVLAEFKTGKWPESLIDKTNYLLAAEAISHATPPGGSIAVSGFMFALYPLTGYLPPTPELSNLSASIIKLNLSSSRLRDALLLCPPDVLMTTSRVDWPGGSELLTAVYDTGIYEKIAEIETTDRRVYGGFGGTIFRAIHDFPCEQSTHWR